MTGKTLLLALLCSSVLLGTGCRSMNAKKSDASSTIAVDRVFDFDGIPKREYYVGGGYTIRYITKQDGTLFLADDTEKRLLETICMQAGEKYETKYGVRDINTAIKLYFVPGTLL